MTPACSCAGPAGSLWPRLPSCGRRPARSWACPLSWCRQRKRRPPMRVEVAQTAGFCFGVDRAVSTVYRLLEEGKKAATLGPIIHNPQVTGDLAARGVRVVSRPEETPPGYMLVIRSHGVPREVEEKGAGAGPLLCGRHLPFCEKDSQLGGARRRAGTGLPAGWGQESSRGAGDCRPLQRGEFCYKEQRRIGGTAEKPSGIGKETPGFCGSDHLSRRRMGKMRGNSEKTMYKRRSFCYNM